jgi:hypothetical protein
LKISAGAHPAFERGVDDSYERNRRSGGQCPS